MMTEPDLVTLGDRVSVEDASLVLPPHLRRYRFRSFLPTCTCVSMFELGAIMYI